jgi:hypothetical protein
VSYPSQWNALAALNSNGLGGNGLGSNQLSGNGLSSNGLSGNGLSSNGHVNGNGLGGAGAVTCALCGIELVTDDMVPDGGRACADIRWYCKDASGCTERWTARLTRSSGASGG